MAYREIKGKDYSIRRMHQQRSLGYRIAGRWEPWGIVLFLALLTALLMRGWLGPVLPSTPRNEILADMAYTQTLLDELRQGRLPSPWNPREFNGFPWLSFTSWLFYGLVALTGYLSRVPITDLFKAVQFLCFLASSLAMYLYVRSLTGERGPATIAAAIYLWLPCHAHLAVETPYHSAIWALIPLILYTDERMLAASGSRRRHWAAGLGALVALMTVITVEYTIVAAFPIGIYILVREAMAVRGGRSTLRQSTLRLLAASLIALGLAAFVVLPQLGSVPTVAVHVKQGAASVVSAAAITQAAVTPGMVLRAIARRTHLPIPYGQMPLMANVLFQTAWYPGLLLPVLGILGLSALRRQPVARVVVVALGLSLLQALDGLLPGNPFGFVPALNKMLPLRSELLVAVFSAALAGLGAQALGRRLPQSLRGWLVLAFTGLLVLDFAPSTSAFLGVAEYFSPQEQAAQRWLDQHAGSGYRLWEPGAGSREEYRLTLSILRAGIPRYWGYYDNESAVHTWLLHMQGDPATSLRLSSVRYAVLRLGGPKDGEWLATLAGAGFRPVEWGIEGLQLFEATDLLPYARAYRLAALQIDAQNTAGLDLLPVLASKGIALVSGPSGYLDDYAPDQARDYAYVFADGARERRAGQAAELRKAWAAVLRHPAQAPALGPAIRPEEQVTWQRRGPEEIDVFANLEESSLVTIAESYHPNWKVAVDGRPAPLLRVNYAFQGVWVPAGQHAVAFYYERPASEYLGALISLGTVLGLIGIPLVILGRRLAKSRHG